MSARLTRSQLYRWMWTTPAERIGEVLGMSGSTLAKICKKFDVPTPARGYWRKVQTRHADPIPPLPNPQDVRLTSIEVSDEIAADLDSGGADSSTVGREPDAQREGTQTQTASEESVNARNQPEADAPPVEDLVESIVDGSHPQEPSDARAPDAAGLRRLAIDRLLYAELVSTLDRLQGRAQEVDPGTAAVLSLWVVLARQELAHLDPVEQIVTSCHLMAAGAERPAWAKAVLGLNCSDLPRRG